MKPKPLPLLRDLVQNQSNSIFDPSAAVDRLDQELDKVQISEEPTKEADRIFPMVAKVYLPGVAHRPEMGEGSLPPILIVRFPVLVEDPNQWSVECQSWHRRQQLLDLEDRRGSAPS